MIMTVNDERNIMKLVKALLREPDGKDEILRCVDDFEDLVRSATSMIDHGDISEFCDEVRISEYWFGSKFEYDIAEQDYVRRW